MLLTSIFAYFNFSSNRVSRPLKVQENNMIVLPIAMISTDIMCLFSYSYALNHSGYFKSLFHWTHTSWIWNFFDRAAW